LEYHLWSAHPPVVIRLPADLNGGDLSNDLAGGSTSISGTSTTIGTKAVGNGTLKAGTSKKAAKAEAKRQAKQSRKSLVKLHVKGTVQDPLTSVQASERSVPHP
jgi:hypothetical protein